jgi:hypothetical protein
MTNDSYLYEKQWRIKDAKSEHLQELDFEWQIYGLKNGRNVSLTVAYGKYKESNKIYSMFSTFNEPFTSNGKSVVVTKTYEILPHRYGFDIDSTDSNSYALCSTKEGYAVVLQLQTKDNLAVTAVRSLSFKTNYLSQLVLDDKSKMVYITVLHIDKNSTAVWSLELSNLFNNPKCRIFPNTRMIHSLVYIGNLNVATSTVSDSSPFKISIHKTDFTINEAWTIELYHKNFSQCSRIEQTPGMIDENWILYKNEMFSDTNYIVAINLTEYAPKLSSTWQIDIDKRPFWSTFKLLRNFNLRIYILFDWEGDTYLTYLDNSGLDKSSFLAENTTFVSVVVQNEKIFLLKKDTNSTYRLDYTNVFAINAIDSFDLMNYIIVNYTDDIVSGLDTHYYFIDEDKKLSVIKIPPVAKKKLQEQALPIIPVSHNLGTWDIQLLNTGKNNLTVIDNECDYTCSDDENIQIEYSIENNEVYEFPKGIKLAYRKVRSY